MGVDLGHCANTKEYANKLRASVKIGLWFRRNQINNMGKHFNILYFHFSLKIICVCVFFFWFTFRHISDMLRALQK